MNVIIDQATFDKAQLQRIKFLHSWNTYRTRQRRMDSSSRHQRVSKQQLPNSVNVAIDSLHLYKLPNCLQKILVIGGTMARINHVFALVIVIILACTACLAACAPANEAILANTPEPTATATPTPSPSPTPSPTPSPKPTPELTKEEAIRKLNITSNMAFSMSDDLPPFYGPGAMLVNSEF